MFFKEICMGFILFSLIWFANGLKCWHCASDTEYGGICRDPYNTTEGLRRNILLECVAPTNSESSVHCRKFKFHVNGQNITTRSCVVLKSGKSETDCSKESTEPYIEIQSCQLCNTDGCNGSEMD